MPPQKSQTIQHLSNKGLLFLNQLKKTKIVPKRFKYFSVFAKSIASITCQHSIMPMASIRYRFEAKHTSRSVPLQHPVAVLIHDSLQLRSII